MPRSKPCQGWMHFGGWMSEGPDHCSVWRSKTVPDPRLRENIMWTFSIRLDLVSKLPDIYTKILRIRDVIPQFPQQESVRQYFAGMLNKHAQELVFLRRQLHLAVANLDEAPNEIDRQLADTKNRPFSLNVQLMPKCGTHSGEQFVHTERLCHVVVRSEIESLDLAGLIATARQNHDRYALVARADCSQQIEALYVRQSEIKNDEVRLLRQHLQRGLAVRSFQDFVALGAEPHAKELADGALVIDHKDLGRSSTHGAVSSCLICVGTGSRMVNTAPM